MIKAIVRNFYMSVNVRFTQATTRGDDTMLIKLIGSSNISRYFSIYIIVAVLVIQVHLGIRHMEVPALLL